MRSSRINSFFISGLFIITGGCLVMALPSPSDNPDGMRADNYDDYDGEYADDQSAPSQQTKTPAADSIAATSRPFFPQPEITVTGVIGKNITLECNAKGLGNSSVILWYKGEKLLTSGHQVISPEYGLDSSNNALHITNATESSQGDYFCEVVPQKVRLHTTLTVAEHPIEAIVPESSTSSQDRCQFQLTSWLVVAASISRISLYYLRS